MPQMLVMRFASEVASAFCPAININFSLLLLRWLQFKYLEKSLNAPTKQVA